MAAPDSAQARLGFVLAGASIREALSERVLMRHEPNLPSGGKASVIEVGEFLSRGRGPEQQALLRLMGSLVERKPT
jgi:hypothetical protein